MIITDPMLSRKNFTLLVLLAGLSAQSVRAECRSADNDSSFASDNGPNVRQFLIGDRPLYFRISRVVGPGKSYEYVPETDPIPSNRGTLIAGDSVRQNAVVSQKANVKLSVTILLGASFWQLVSLTGDLNGGPASAAVKVKFFMNGQPIGRDFIVSTTISDPNVPASKNLTRCVEIPTQYLRFARRNDSTGGPCPSSLRTGETTCPGVNELDLKITQLWYGSPSALAAAGGSPSGLFSLPFLGLTGSTGAIGAILDSISVIPYASSLSFKAMHPVILIHGNSSSDKFWTNQATCSGCDPHWNFEQPFIDQHIPYFDEFNMVNATAEVHAPFLRGRIDVATRRFGAKYVNLVGHSKGGSTAECGSRQMLDCGPIIRSCR